MSSGQENGWTRKCRVRRDLRQNRWQRSTAHRRKNANNPSLPNELVFQVTSMSTSNDGRHTQLSTRRRGRHTHSTERIDSSTGKSRSDGARCAFATLATSAIAATALFASVPGVGADSSTVSAGWRHSCVLLTDGDVKCFGYNQWGQIGTGDGATRGDGSTSGSMGDDLPVVNLGRDETAVGVSAGYSHTCAVLASGRVKCWGRNNYGQLGQGDYVDRGETAASMGNNLTAIDLGTGPDGESPMLATAVTTGKEFTCVLLEDSSVKCLGRNDQGQLGRGDTEAAIGSNDEDLGDALPVVDLGTDATVSAITSGEAATCAVLESGELKCWGTNAYGGLGLEDAVTRGDESGDMGDDLPEVSLGSSVDIESIAYGWRHVCAIVSGGQVKCWGDNRSGQLGQGHVDTIGDDEGEMGDDLPFVDLGDADAQAVWMALGESHSCAMLSSADIKCWGKGFSGQLGEGTYTARGKASGEMGSELPSVDLGTTASPAVFDSGYDHTCAALDDGSLKCWGLNLLGALGLGDKANRGDDSREMGDDLSAVNLGTGVEVALIDAPTLAPTGVPTPAPVVETPVPTAAPTAAATLITPAPTVLTAAPVAPETPAPTMSDTPAPVVEVTPAPTRPITIAPTSAVETKVEAEASATDGEEGFFDGQTGIMMAVVAPVALLSLLLCVCIGCRRKRQRETASASTAARNSYKSDGGSSGLGGLGGHKAAVSRDRSELSGFAAAALRSQRSGSFGGSNNDARVLPSTSEESGSPPSSRHEDEGAGGARGGGYAVGDDAFYFEGDRYNDGDTSSGTGTASAGSGAPGSAPRTRTYT